MTSLASRTSDLADMAGDARLSRLLKSGPTRKHTMTGASFPLEVNAIVPPAIARLEELAGNLRFSWHRPTRALFFSLGRRAVEARRRQSQAVPALRRSGDARSRGRDPEYLARYERVLAGFDGYRSDTTHGGTVQLDSGDLVAYFCAEYRLPRELSHVFGRPRHSRGRPLQDRKRLGLTFVAVGLLYRQGYFTQTLDADGYQIATYRDFEHDDLPVELVRGADGREVRVQLPAAEALRRTAHLARDRRASVRLSARQQRR